MIAVSDLSGSGGAERLFADLLEYVRRERRSSRLTLITATSALARLRVADRLSSSDGVIALPLGDRPGRGYLAMVWMTLRVLAVILRHRFDVVHVCLPSPIYVPLLAVLARLPPVLRPRLTLTVIDCTLAPGLEGQPPADTYEQQVLDAHRLYVRWTRLDAIFSWYRAFADLAVRQPAAAGTGMVRAARYCFTEPARFVPAPRKDNLAVFAGRLSAQKRPVLFVEAVARLRQRHPDLMAGWRFELYGRGDLEAHVRQRIGELGLSDVMSLSHGSDMAPVFARSRLFVSTQKFENFTSLAMLEAMAAGNAIIAEDVGQTREFVRDAENGYLVSSASAEGFADALVRYLERPDDFDRFARASRALTTEVHTVDHFVDDIMAFWADVKGG
jgi:glycosyltransferase involved in cell wall biosynthesis